MQLKETKLKLRKIWVGYDNNDQIIIAPFN